MGWARPLFEQVVIGSTQDEVIERVGRPDRTIENDGATVLVYDDATADQASGKFDITALVTFEKGKAVAINYVPLPASGGEALEAKGATRAR